MSDRTRQSIMISNNPYSDDFQTQRSGREGKDEYKSRKQSVD